ncbi:MAG: hypothetical protein FD155_1966 [Bacteroidetes bacterium]|nr:MAG: hypothetical protein FD155_1966 [Bacteroidota bacterium]
MKIIELKENENVSNDMKVSQYFNQLDLLLNELRNREIPDKIIESINSDLEEINATLLVGKMLLRLLKKKQLKILKLIEKELKIVPKNHYRNLWLVLGMSAFGVPFGVAFGTSTGNMGLIGIGFPIGMGIGIALGAGLDKKAFNEGRQLNVEAKY